MEGGNSIPRGSIISCIREFKMISKVYLYHIVTVQDLDSEIPPIQSVPRVSEFLKVFPIDLPSIRPEQEIDLTINFLLDTNPITILLIGWLLPN